MNRRPLPMRRLAWPILLLVPALSLAAPRPGSVAVHSDGSVRRLLEVSDAGARWEDQRLRTELLPSNPLLPPRWRVGLDGRVQFRQHLLKGRPDRLLNAPPGSSETFVVARIDARGNRSERHFECRYLGPASRRLDGRREAVRHFRCERFAIHRKFWTRVPKETIETWWSPRLGLVLESHRRRPDGRSRQRRLLELLPPGAYRYRKVVELLRRAGAKEVRP